MNALPDISLMEKNYDHALEHFHGITEYLDSEKALEMSQSEIEREIEKQGIELMRKLLQEHLNRRGLGRCVNPVQDTDGVERKTIRIHDRKIETIFGTITLERSGYEREGCDSLHPLDAGLNLPDERYSLEVRRRVAMEAASSSFNETIETIGQNTGARVPKRQAEELVKRAAQDFDAFYENRHDTMKNEEETGPILVISVDGKGVTMLERDLREQTRKAALERIHKMGARLSKGEKKNAKRMACVAAVYTIDPFIRTPEEMMSPFELVKPQRPRPEQKRVWASLEKEPEQVIGDALEESRHRDPEGKKTWVALVDGNKSQIRYLRHQAQKNRIDLTIVVDVIHVIEYLWKAGRAFYPKSGTELEQWVRHRILEVLRGKARLVAGGMRRSATRRGLSADARKPVDICARYLLTYAPYQHYDRYLAEGLPIATGVIEGACRYLVKDRMDVTGARWSLAGAEAVLKLRALRSSHDFDEYWAFHEKCEHARTHQSRYHGGVVPSVTHSFMKKKRSHLSLVKK